MNKVQFLETKEQDRLSRVLKGKAFYANVHTPNTSGVAKFNSEPYFIVNLGLSPEEAKKAQSYGLKVFDPEGEINLPYVKLKRKVSKGKTAAQVAPEVVDTMQNPIPKNILIGNNSDVVCKFATYWYDTGGGGVGSALYKVQVTNLVPYTKLDKGFVNDGSGFIVQTTQDVTLNSDENTNDGDINFDDGDPLPWETPAPKKSKKS
jgi:hypothetical protein